MSRWKIRVALALTLFLGGLPQGAEAAQPTVVDVIAQMAVKGRAAKTGYTRDQFGPVWKDVNHNGCDTRNDILNRDLSSIIYKVSSKDCVILSGILLDPYSGEVIDFLKGVATSSDVQIDHVVALSNAWQTGAFKLTLEKRTAFANDPLNLLAVKGRLNSQKGDGDAATWLPPLKSYRCTYVARQVAVKYKYGLWLTAPEKAAILKLLQPCPGQLIPAG
ncbi:MAG: HNH endonuclease [Candidatus Planktophila sp.]|nr:HNH endonuclease [Candidatus Planktophila sp.]